uniref:Uncharacterized protein n=1 Tax=Chromera velia CCMP2878 TaxID=1169474 RepID=A0A0G4HZY2_9ALVE|eukprot:Cvel_9815.t1-p1 / transcript=Cvel_9815.t1 / gene=Cvel_9815 / organism=Chromera_velia_CCMP2878 / gene_product=hypothetical protein / transcript_product=hypothetical protein / location=Cvel_scaffold576:26052-26384(-) / protein_length=111 / sequence_SO=supercontig / SO=protein_coding / is_pseudo=false
MAGRYIDPELGELQTLQISVVDSGVQRARGNRGLRRRAYVKLLDEDEEAPLHGGGEVVDVHDFFGGGPVGKKLLLQYMPESQVSQILGTDFNSRRNEFASVTVRASEINSL